MRKLATLTALAGALLLLGAAPATAAPILDVGIAHPPEGSLGIPTGGTAGQYRIIVSNVGADPTNDLVDVDLTLPAGLKATAVSESYKTPVGLQFWSCTIAPDSQSVSCTGPDDPRTSAVLPIGPGEEACPDNLESKGPDFCRIVVTVVPDSGLSVGEMVTADVEACGGGAASCASDSLTSEIVPPVSFDLLNFDGGAFDELGDPETRAGSHPHTASADFRITKLISPAGQSMVSGLLRDVITELPPGVIGNPQAVPVCPYVDFANGGGTASQNDDCPRETQIGVVIIEGEGSGVPGYGQDPGQRYFAPLFNLAPPQGTAALLGFKVTSIPIFVSAEVRTGGDYGVNAINRGAPITILTSGVEAQVWGVPADPSHDRSRGDCIDNFGRLSGNSCPSADKDDPKAFFTLPTSCEGQPRTDLTITSWEGGEARASFISPTNTECDAVPFAPTLQARPTTNVADSPSGLDVDLHIPQENIEVPGEIVSAHLRDTTVTLPEGLTINASGANGLDGCSSAEVGLTSAPGATPVTYTPDAARCPDAAKVANVEVETPLLDHPIRGSAYIATPFDNPFNRLLALYIAIDDAQSGVVVKLAGEVNPDPVTGRITSTFENNPQVPFSDFHLDFFGGAGGSLKTPATCGDYTTTSSLTPWSAPFSGPPETPSDTWQITQGPGIACANSAGELANAPSFDAGTLSPISNVYSPFVLRLRREDGSQRFSALNVTLPQGMTGKLAGTALCPDGALAAAAQKSGNAERASPSCPLDSRVGVVNAAAGAGPAPYHAQGIAYLAGPYKGAPVSMAVITPATAGPFDLGTIVIRTPLYVDSKTAQISAITDPIPQILEGIPLDVRSVNVVVDRPEFTLNGTSCDPSAVNGLLTSTLNQAVALSSRYQLSDCTRLPFKPKMTLTLRGGTKRGAHPALTIALMPRAGDANIASISVGLPRSEFLENAHIRTICTRPDFAADNCPAGAIYGEASVDTPLLDYDLGGHVYLRSSSNLLPDVVPDLRGPAHQPIRLETSGRTDSIRGGIRTTIDFVPDAPFTKALVRLQGANKGLLVNSRDICARAYRATVRYIAHNGLTYVDHPKMQVKCGKRGRRGKKGKRGGHRRSKRVAYLGAVR